MRLPLRFPTLRAGLLDASEAPCPLAGYREMVGKLRLARQSARISRAELAEYLMVSETVLEHWECGLSAPGVLKFIRWAGALGMRIDAMNARRRTVVAEDMRTAA